MSRVYLGIGSNVDTRTNVLAGVRALRQQFGDISLSPVYQSASVGFDGNDFINLVAGVETDLQPLEMKRFLNRLEDHHGRQREVPKFSDRTLDIDILMFDDLYLHSPDLVLPRPEILLYAHVLQPFADLAPQLVHPVTRTTLAQLWAGFTGQRDSLKRVEFTF